jgi:hypothetical protein
VTLVDPHTAAYGDDSLQGRGTVTIEKSAYLYFSIPVGTFLFQNIPLTVSVAIFPHRIRFISEFDWYNIFRVMVCSFSHGDSAPMSKALPQKHSMIKAKESH